MATVLAASTGRILRGRHSALFCASIAASLGKRYAVSFSRGRFAIEVILRGLHIGVGDDVVVPSYICSTVVDGIAAAGAAPRFADVADDLNMSLECVLRAITPTTRCVIVPHLFGRAAAVDEIETAMNQRGILLIDDAAQSFGAQVRGRPVGSYGIAGIVGCGAGKSLSGAAGGLLVTDDPELYQFATSQSIRWESAIEVMRRLLSHWLFRRFRYVTLPLEYLLYSGGERPRRESLARMANIDAAIGRAQLAKADINSEQRRSNAARMAAVFADAGIRHINNYSSSQVALKLVIFLPDTGPPIVEALKILADAGIECQMGYVPCHLGGNTCCAPDPSSVPLSTTEALWQRVVCIPVERIISPELLAKIGARLKSSASPVLASPPS